MAALLFPNDATAKAAVGFMRALFLPDPAVGTGPLSFSVSLSIRLNAWSELLFRSHERIRTSSDLLFALAFLVSYSCHVKGASFQLTGLLWLTSTYPLPPASRRTGHPHASPSHQMQWVTHCIYKDWFFPSRSSSVGFVAMIFKCADWLHFTLLGRLMNLWSDLRSWTSASPTYLLALHNAEALLLTCL